MVSPAFSSFVLPNGSTLKNRIVKAAMEENMADVTRSNMPSESMIRLYHEWAQGGAGLIISGHVMIDPKAMACPGDVLLAEDVQDCDEQRWREWAEAGQKSGTQFWLQINHPGRQIKKGSGLPTYAPSAVPINLGRYSSLFEEPYAMDEEHIQDVIRRFRWTARRAEQLGFSGVEIHAAHGYLLSQFLSPLVNQRTDQWGGSLANRARLLIEVVREVRKAVSPGFGVGVKINSSDFQRGGFDAKDLKFLILQLNSMKLDFVELSGGSAESPAMRGSHQQKKKADSTLKREAYFLEFVEDLKTTAEMPLVITGGIRTKETLHQVIASSDNILAGVGTGLGLQPDLVNQWIVGKDPAPEVSTSWVLPGVFRYAASTACVQFNLHLIGKGWRPLRGIWPFIALIISRLNEKRQLAQYKRWVVKMVKQ